MGFWWVFGGFLVGFWWVFGGFLVGFWCARYGHRECGLIDILIFTLLCHNE